MGEVFASQNGKFQTVLDIEQYDSTIASISVPMILRIDRPVPLDRTLAIVLHRPPRQ
jgi:hypothetical protein